MKLLSLTLLGFSLSFSVALAEASTPKVGLSCRPTKALMNETNTFEIVKGEGVELGCFIINPTKDTVSGMLLGKQNVNGVSNASSTMVHLPGEQNTALILTFPPLFVPGAAYYSLVLLGEKGEVLSGDVVLTGRVKGEEQLSIAKASLDKTEYAWDDLAILSLEVSAHGQEDSLLKSTEPTVSIEMLTKEELNCATVLGKQKVTGVKTEYRFNFSEQNLCVNGIKVVLQDKKGKTLDQKIIAVSLPERMQGMTKGSGKTLLSLDQPMGILVWIGILCLIFLAYALWRHHKKQ